jgi:hypothetical protein
MMQPNSFQFFGIASPAHAAFAERLRARAASRE